MAVHASVARRRETLTAHRYRQLRGRSEALCRTLEPEDYVVQSMPDVSPTKWHLAHTTWFFEKFVLEAAQPGRPPWREGYHYLFNSYYETVGSMHPRPSRGLLSRPTVAEVYAYREAIDDAVAGLLERDALDDDTLLVLEVGLHHEQQHQELMLTDIKHVFAQNPLRPALVEQKSQGPAEAPPALRFVERAGGLREIGTDGEDGFAFDNEGPRHRVWVEDHLLANRLVTCREYLDFIGDDGYRRPELWLSQGWSAVKEQGLEAPLYWEQRDGEWWIHTLGGTRPLRLDTPVCHVSFFEADAYARWAGKRLPTEAEWELAAVDAADGEVPGGNFVESGALHPMPVSGDPGGLLQLFGDVWEWTQSPYSAYPGFRPLEGSLGEYNGKFMCNQLVLRGGSCATPADHIRPTYRNFFYGPDRWQFTGIRLADDARTGGKRGAGRVGGRPAEIAVVDVGPEVGRMREEVVDALGRSPRELPTKYLYDEHGSHLFDQICELEEYYPTRTELGILKDHVAEMARALGPDVLLVEPGSGSSLKTRRLLQALERPVGYVPSDISGEHLRRSAQDLAATFRDLEVLPVVADFTAGFAVPTPARRARRTVVYFPGSTIGNFDPEGAVALLSRFREMAGEGGAVLLGVDLKKDRRILEAAYNDSEGVTAAFNLNLLRHVNEAVGSDFVLEDFTHEAIWNEAEGRIEMYLVSLVDQAVHLGEHVFRLEAGEAVLTEHSHKYSLEGFAELAEEAGLEVKRVWTDPERLFSVQLLEPLGG